MTRKPPATSRAAGAGQEISRNPTKTATSRWWGDPGRSIISGGFNIHPSEVETALASHPAVEDCTVFGVPDERWGEAPVAYVVRSAEVTADALIAHCTDQLARYKRPREVVFVDTIPRTPSGKVQKPPLRTAYLKGISG